MSMKYESNNTSKVYLFFLHGLGAGHLAYISLIYELTTLGYYNIYFYILFFYAIKYKT